VQGPAARPGGFELYVWKSPRGLDADEAAGIVRNWQQLGADPAHAPFEASDDVTWFFRELIRDEPELDITTDATPIYGRLPVWLAGAASDEPAPKTHVAVVHMPAGLTREVLESIFGLATKYDLVVFDPHRNRVYEPMAEMAKYASATFWPRGAIRTVVAGVIGLAIAVGSWVVGIPILNVVGVLVGGFLVVLCVVTLAFEARRLIGGNDIGKPS
jgi:hypothetical protein